MSSLVLVEKLCRVCDQMKPLTDFHRSQSMADGYRNECRACVNETTRQSIARRRAEMGEAAWLKRQRSIVAASRDKTGNVAGKAYNQARRRALTELAARHPKEFAALFAAARREVEAEAA